MKKRALGTSGLKVAPLALGTNVFGWTVDEPTAFALLDAFTDAGFNLIDTADVYSRWVPGNEGGESETIIGNWLARSGKRDKVIIATKVGQEMGPGRRGLSRAHIVSAAEDSLRRLRTDRIDLYQSHQDDPATPLEETLEAYDGLIRDGKVRFIGASNYSAPRLAEALKAGEERGLPLYRTLQPLYNLHDRDGFEAELLPLCREKKLGVITYYSLASGFLSGKYRGDADLARSPRGGRVARYMSPRGMRILAALDEVAAGAGSQPAAVALAWLMARPGITAPISSATSLEQLRVLMSAADLKLDAASRALLDRASA